MTLEALLNFEPFSIKVAKNQHFKHTQKEQILVIVQKCERRVSFFVLFSMLYLIVDCLCKGIYFVEIDFVNMSNVFHMLRYVS